MPSEITFARFGGPDVLEWTNTAEMPEPLPSQVVIVVAAAAVSTMDARIRNGDLRDTITTFLPSGAGRDVAGVVIARGRAVTDVTVGDEVMGFSDTGAYAQFAALSTYVRKPDTLDWAVAASLPTATDTAYRVLGELGLSSGQTLVVTGGAGAVGSLAVQIAVSRGIRVITSVGSGDESYVRGLGAEPQLYGAGCDVRIMASAPEGIDGIFDTAGSRLIPILIGMVDRPDKVVSISDNSAEIYGARFSAADSATRSTALLREAAALAAAGILNVRIARRYPLSKAAKAHRDLALGKCHGRLVLVNGA